MFEETHVTEALKEIENHRTAFQLAFSGGKDSTALVGLFNYAMKQGLDVDFSIIHANTLMEMPFLDDHVNKVANFCSSLGVDFKFVYAPMKHRFFYSVLGRGVAIPNRNFRWCTDKLKIKPMQALYDKSRVFVNGERLGESNKRDIKLNVCGGANECGTKEHTKVADQIFRPLLNWRTCQVWDFILFAESEGCLPEGTFNNLSVIYSINKTEDNSMRTGCLGCPLVNKDKSLEAFVSLQPEYAPLTQVKGVYDWLRLPEQRLLRYSRRSPQGSPGCIKLSSRLVALQKLEEIETQAKHRLIQEDERKEIYRLLSEFTYPRGYNYSEQQVKEDIDQYLTLVNRAA